MAKFQRIFNCDFWRFMAGNAFSYCFWCLIFKIFPAGAGLGVARTFCGNFWLQGGAAGLSAGGAEIRSGVGGLGVFTDLYSLVVDNW